MSRLATPMSVIAVAGASIALVACGGSSGDRSSASSGSGGSGTTTNGAQGAAFQKFQQCLKDNGVTLPDRGNRQGGGGYGPPAGGGAPPAGGPGFGGQADAKTQKAMQACAKYRPQGMGQGRGGNGTGAPRQSIKAFTPYLTCLKDQGLDVKVADGFNALRDLKQDDPKVQAAFKACQSKLPQRPQQQGTSTTSTTGSAT